MGSEVRAVSTACSCYQFLLVPVQGTNGATHERSLSRSWRFWFWQFKLSLAHRIEVRQPENSQQFAVTYHLGSAKSWAGFLVDKVNARCQRIVSSHWIKNIKLSNTSLEQSFQLVFLIWWIKHQIKAFFSASAAHLWTVAAACSRITGICKLGTNSNFIGRSCWMIFKFSLNDVKLSMTHTYWRCA